MFVFCVSSPCLILVEDVVLPFHYHFVCILFVSCLCIFIIGPYVPLERNCIPMSSFPPHVSSVESILRHYQAPYRKVSINLAIFQSDNGENSSVVNQFDLSHWRNSMSPDQQKTAAMARNLPRFGSTRG